MLPSMLQILGFAVLPAIAVIWFATAVIGTADPRAPRCGSCREPLGFPEMALHRPCRACGTLVEDRAPTPARRRPAWRAAALGVLFLILAGSAAWLGTALQFRAAVFTPSLALVPTVMTATSPGAGAVAQTVAAVRDGRIAHADLRAVLASALAKPTPAIQTSATLRLAALALEDKDATPEELAAHWSLVLSAAFPPASAAPAFLATTNPTLMLDPTREPPSYEPIGRVVVVRQAWVDDVEVPLERFVTGASTGEPPLFPLAIQSFARGPHTLRVAVDAYLFPSFDLDRIGARESNRLREADWPTPLATERSEFTITFTAP